MSKDHRAVESLVDVLWAQFGSVAMVLQDWGTTEQWLKAFNMVKDSDNVLVTDLRNEQDVDLIQSQGGVVLRL
jgi:hypothetical protein